MSKSLEDFIKEYMNTPQWKRRLWRLQGKVRDLKSLKGKVVNLYQRARYGVGYQDAWNLDTHFAQVINHGARHLCEANHSYPGEHNGWTEEQWQLFLMELSVAMETYADEGEFNTLELRDKCKELLHTMVDNFDSLWD
jgi:hypothetical protein